MIAEKILALKQTLPASVQLIAVSKTKPNEDIIQAYQAGQRVFGENKVQEMADKYESLPKDIQWNLIGHLQTNKVKVIADKVHLIHSMDRISLFAELERQARKNEKKINVLIQFHIAREETKHGFSIEDAVLFLKSTQFKESKFIQICGVMGMASFTDDRVQIRAEFELLKSYFDQIKSSFFADSPFFNILSMGMSGDYDIALECGSNMIRVGSAIFGER
jgi:pyridoxal phosphate enzyme (YggS family)